MTAWEYAELEVKFTPVSIGDTISSRIFFYDKEKGFTEKEVKGYGPMMRELGLQGWEMVAGVTHQNSVASLATPYATSFIFKRQLGE